MIHAKTISPPTNGCRKITHFPRNFPDSRIQAVEIWRGDVLVERLEVDAKFTWPRELVTKFNQLHSKTESDSETDSEFESRPRSVAYAVVSDVDEL